MDIFTYINFPLDIQKLKFDHIWGNSGPDSGPYCQTEFSGNFHRGQYNGSIGELDTNVAIIFIWIFLHIHVPMDIKN